MAKRALSLLHRVVSALKLLTTTAILCVVTMAAILVAAPAAFAQSNGRAPVYLAGSGNVALDQHVQKLLEQNLESQNDLILISDEQAALTQDGPIVTLGPRAFSRIRQVNRKAPLLALLVEPDFLQGFVRRSPGQVSGVYHGAPLLRQALIGKAILPQATRIALISTTDTAELYDTLIDQLPAYKLEARLFVVDDDKQLIPTLIRALSYGDFLLAAPDDAIYNPRTIKHILLTAYRRNKIVIGPSQAYVKAGSLASGYAPFAGMAEMATEFINEYFESGQFPSPAYPELYRIELNKQVARSLNIPLPDKKEINNAVQKLLNETGGPNIE